MPQRIPTMKPGEQLDNAVGPPMDANMEELAPESFLPGEEPGVDDPALDESRMAEYAGPQPEEVPVDPDSPDADAERMVEYATNAG